MRRRVVHIHGRDLHSWFPPEGTDPWYLSGWSGVIAQHTAAQSDRYEVENWRPDSSVSKVLTKTVSGVTCRVFPASEARDLKYGPRVMWDCLRVLHQQGPVIIHHSSIHHTGLYHLLWEFADLPIVAQHHGEASPFVSFNRRGPLKRVTQWIMEAILLRRAAHLLFLRQSEADYLNRIAPNVPKTFLTVGTEFHQPISNASSRSAAKRQLGLDPNLPVVLYVGRFYRLKSVEHILAAWRSCVGQRSTTFCLVGGSDQDELFADVTSSGVHWRPFLPHSDVLLYHQAADVYVSPFFVCGGFDVSVMEALSYGVPVVSQLLTELPTADRAQLGVAVRNADEIEPAIFSVLENPERFSQCRTVAQRWFGWQTITSRLLEVYDGIPAD